MMYNADDAYIGRSLQLYGEYCEADVHLFRGMVRSGHTVLDIGANIGPHTVYFAKAVGPAGRVIAIEPQSSAFRMLCANLVLNGHDNVTPMRAAVGRETGVVDVPRAGEMRVGNLGAFSLTTPMGDGVALEPVPLTTIDALNLPACHFAKIDVEGMEEDVVHGAAATLKRHRPMLYLENNQQHRSPALIQSLLDLDYRCFWYTASYFNPGNYFGCSRNVFARHLELNMVAVPRLVAHMIEGLRAVTSPEDWPISA